VLSGGPRVAVVAAGPRPDRISPLVPELTGRLRELGCRVDLLDPDAAPLDLAAVRAEADLYVLKSGTEAGLSLGGALDAAGARVLNPYPVAAACRDKIVQTRTLQAAGVPVPRSWLTVDPAALAGELAAGPLILKDPRGSRGRGIVVARTAERLAALRTGVPWLAMRYHEPEGPDLKLYRIGADVFGVERVFPARTYAAKVGRPYQVPPRLRSVVRRCGEAFGIAVYGVDVVRSGGREWVVDMSSFPGFKGVPAAGARIAEHVLAQLDGGAAAVAS
jgi:ribosomal protein S6--L-glutamate ligase